MRFTAHNIRLDNGEYTCPHVGYSIGEHPWFRATRRTLEAVFQGDVSKVRLADLGCLEGGYAVEFARLGYDVLGLEVRPSNIRACEYVKAHTHLPNLRFVEDTVWNLQRYGRFDAVFCCGLLYHLADPRRFLKLVSAATNRLLVVQTHFATDRPNPEFSLSYITEHEGYLGRWYTEYPDDASFNARDDHPWTSWENRSSFWLKHEYLLQALLDAGFDIVAEQFDALGDNIAESMSTGYYSTNHRGLFIAVKGCHERDINQR